MWLSWRPKMGRRFREAISVAEPSSSCQLVTGAPQQPNATPTPSESGTQTTRVNAHDDSASVTLSLSDSTPPDVNGFGISLKIGSVDYQMPYQPVQSPTQVEATRQGKSYTLTGTGHAVIPGQTGMRELPFGVHVTCP